MIKRYTMQQNITNNDISILKKHISGSFASHWHEFYEIEYIINGSGKYIIDDNSYQIQPGMIFFMTPINFHELKNVEADIINIMFSPNFSSADALFPLSEQGVEHAVEFSDSDCVFTDALLAELQCAAKKNNIIYASSLLSSLLFKLGNIIKKNSLTKPTYIQTAMLYMQSNFRNQITLSDVANVVGLSPAYLSNIFSKESGVSFKKHLNDLRYEYAKKLLAFSDMSVSEICFASGFNDYTNFFRGFKKHYGKSPMQYKDFFKLSHT